MRLACNREFAAVKAENGVVRARHATQAVFLGVLSADLLQLEMVTAVPVAARQVCRKIGADRITRGCCWGTELRARTAGVPESSAGGRVSIAAAKISVRRGAAHDKMVNVGNRADLSHAAAFVYGDAV